MLLVYCIEYLLKFHNVVDAKSLWEAIKSRFVIAPSIMRSSNSASQNLAFLSSKNTSSTNEVSTTSGDFGVSTAGGINQVPSTPCAYDVLYERLKRQDQNFVAIGSAEDERQIKEMNEESKDPEKKRLKKRVVNEEDTAKVPAKQEATEQGTKKRKSGHIMADSAIIISSDSSDESVGSPPSRVILFGDIPTVIPSTSVVAPETSTIAPVISSAAPVVETTLVASPTGLCGLVPYTGSDSDSPDEMTSPEHISPLPAISPFICTDSSEAPDSSDGPPSQDPYVATVARWRSRVTARPSSSHEFPIAPVTAPPGIRRRSATLIRPGEAIPFGRPYRTHLFNRARRSLLTARKRVRPLPACRLASRQSSPSLSGSSHPSSCQFFLRFLRPVHSLGYMRQIRLIRDLRLEIYQLITYHRGDTTT
ncbi:hypothetical protein Tco_0071889 [Tanacetum coccineum]